MQTWKPLQLNGNPEQDAAAIRLNALGSLFYFVGYILKKDRLSRLHKALCKSLESEDLHAVIEMPMLHFKCLSIKELVPTPTGFKEIGNIEIGDKVFGVDGSPVNVLGVSPIKYATDCYEIEFSTGERIVCDAAHLWETESLDDYNNVRPKRYRPAVRTAEQIARKVSYSQQYNHRVRVSQAIQLPDAELPISPYVLGCWLGDGSKSGPIMTIGKSEHFIAEEINREGEPLKKGNDKKGLTWAFCGGYGVFKTKLRSLGVLGDKHIPEVYLRASASQRMALLQGLMDTDGSVSKLGQCTFSNTNLRLIKQVRELLASLGLKPSAIGEYKERLNGEYIGVFHVVSFYSFKTNPPFRLPRKRARLISESPQSQQKYRQIVAVRKVEPRYVKCIMVDSVDSLYLTGEGFIPTHNTTCANEGLSMWWALPFTERDELQMRTLGYGDAWIAWMKKAHDQNARTLITHETEDLAIKVGVAIDSHYQYNDRFRSTFPEVIPTNESWSAHTKYHKRTDSSHSEGTYEYRGAGQSVQGLHMTGIIEDDNVGKAAQDSLNMGDGRVMESIIAYHRLVSSRFDPAYFTKTGMGRQLVIGNRWAPKDLNGWIRANQPEFTIERHSAEGGCCSLHPAGIPIFPEEFDSERLSTMKRTFGPVQYSHFFLNEAVSADDYVFKKEWIRHYRFKPSKPDAPLDDPGNFLMLEHEVRDGETIEDLACGALHIRMIIDLAHAKKRFRCKHVVLIVGLDSESDRLYLLDVWAKASPYSDLVGKMYEMAKKWGLYECWMETVGAQNILKFHIEEKNRSVTRPLRVIELPYDNSENAKTNRIESMEPVYRSGNFWTHRSQTEFTDEYDSYHARKTTDVDVLDTCGYAPKTYETIRRKSAMIAVRQREEWFKGRNVGATGY